MEHKLQGALRYGMAVTLVGTLMVPSTAAFADSDAANGSAQQAHTVSTPADAGASSDGAASGAGAASDASAAGAAVDTAADSAAAGSSTGAAVSASAAPASGAAASESSADATSAGALLSPKAGVDANAPADDGGLLKDAGTGTSDADPNRIVTIIVQLEDGGSQGVSLFSSLLGTAQQDRHSYFKDKIREAAAEKVAATDNAADADAADADASAGATNAGIQLFSGGATNANNAVSAGDDLVQELRDYYHVIDGFAVKAPASTLDAIKSMDGVKNAFLGEEHAVPADEGDQPALKNQDSLNMTQADQVDQKGDGQVIAIVDSGVATAHEAFSGDLDDGTVAISYSDAEADASKLGRGVYASEKIPFAYDYADNDNEATPTSSSLEHGTHVAGIAAANGGDQIRGTAPNAQILAMKTASDATGSLYDDAILAALDDSYAIGVDAVNMSLGTDAGFSTDAANTFADAINKLKEGGTVVNVAAGNAYSAAYGNQSKEDLPYASDPDSGVLASPSALGSSFSVASVDNAQAKSAFEGPDGQTIGYNLMNVQDSLTGTTNGTSPDLSTLADGAYPYIDGGIGTTEDLQAASGELQGDFTGKFVIVQRGGTDAAGNALTFTQKVQNVLAAGYMGFPAGIIVYNNVDGELANVAVQDMYLSYPVVTVSKADGEALKNASNKTITLKAGLTAAASSDYTMSDFSSWGVTPELKLKPEITAPGGNIYSSVLNNGYDYMSGTSMATPQMSGISALVHEYVASDAKFAGLSAAEQGAAVTQLLMSTAKPVADVTNGGVHYSPRKQGAGLTNVPAATSTDVYATVDGADDASRPKADLGESADGTWSFTVTLHNVGSQARTFTPDADALSEQVADGLFQQEETDWKGTGIDVSFSGDAYDAASNQVSVPAGGTASYAVSISAGEAFTSWAAANTPNGTFVEGFATLASTDGGVDLSVPYLGFYGDWSRAKAFDGQLIPTDDSQEPYHIYATANSDPNGYPLGLNVFDSTAMDLAQLGDYSGVDPKKMVVSGMGYDSAPNQLIPLTGLLRGVSNLTYTYKNSAGEAVRTYSHDFASKSYYYATGGYVVSTDSTIGSYSAFDGKNDSGAQLPDGTYTLERTATTAGPGSEMQSDEPVTFQYDTRGPEISNVQMSGSGDDATISFDITDDSWLAAYDFHDPATGGYFYRVIPDDSSLVENADGTRTWSFTEKIADIKAAWDRSEEAIGSSDPIPNTVPLYAWDYGMNYSTPTDTVVTPVPATAITIDSSEVTLAPGQETKLTASVAPEDSTEKNLVWTSSDEGVVTVDAEGNLAGVGNGEAVITVASALNPDVKAAAKVTVAAVPEATGVIMARTSTTVEPGGTAEARALVADSLAGQTVTWESSDEGVVTVAADANDSTKATVTGGDSIGEATVTATVGGKSATMSVEVRPANYNDFVFDESGTTIIAYAGNSSHVEVPQGIKRINDQAFMGTPVQEVVVPTSVESIGKQAFYNTAKLEKVTFEDPENSHLTSVEDQAFYNTLKLREVKLPQSVTTLGTGVFQTSTIQVADLGSATVVPQDAFSQSAQIYNLTMSDKVTEIGDGAFSAALGLSQIKLSHTDDGTAKTGLPSALTRIGNSAFSGTAFSGNLVLPAGVTYVGDEAFSQTQLTGITLPDGLTYFGGMALAGTGVTELTVPDSVNALGSNAFGSMSALAKITLGKNLPNGDAGTLVGAFLNDTSLQTITVPADAANYTQADAALFTKDGATLVAYPMGLTGPYDIPAGTTDVADYAFYQGSVDTVTFPDGLKRIGYSAFLEGKLGGDVVLPDSVETIGGNAFMNLTGLTSVDIGGATSIGGSAFYSDPALAHVNFRTDLNRLVSIGSNAFALGTPLEEVILPDSLTTIGDGAFANNGALKKLHIGAGLTGDISGFVTGSNNLAELTVSESNPVYYAEQNVLYGQMDYGDGAVDENGVPQCDGLHLILSLPTNTFTEYTVKEGTVQIDAQAFRNNTSLQKVVLPEGLKRLSTGSFNNCTSLTDIDFPDSLEYVEGLYDVPLDVADFGTNIVSIPEDAFMGDMPEHLVVRGGKGAGEVYDSMDFTDTPGSRSAYFGEGIKKVSITYGVVPEVIVVPSTMESMSLETYEMGDALKNVKIYAPKDSAAWQVASDAMTADGVGLDPATQLVAYTPLSVTLDVAEGQTPVAGSTVDVTAAATGGVDGAKQYRFFQQNADGTETLVQDWFDASTFSWTVPDGGLTLRAEVRDASYFTTDATLGSLAKPVFATDLDTTPVKAVAGSAPTLTVGVSAEEGAAVSYQWYEDGAPIDGATGASYTPTAADGKEHTYYAVATMTKDGLATTASSKTATVTLFPAATAPTIESAYITANRITLGGKVTMMVTAKSFDGGVLSYQWYEDGAPVEGATGASLEVAADAVGVHTYYVEITNTLGLDGNVATTKSDEVSVTVVADTSKLSAELQSVTEAVAGLNAADYTPASWKALQDALTAAQAVASDDASSQDTVDAALANLQAAYAGLTKADNGGQQPGGGDNQGGGENPGGGGGQGGQDGDTQQPGGNGQPGDQGGDAQQLGGNGDAQQPGDNAQVNKLSQTVDQVPVASVAGVGLLAGAAAAVAAFFARRRRGGHDAE